jgi:hypothetical protein
MFRNLWENIRKDMPKKGRGRGEDLDPLTLPTRRRTAMRALYGHYEKTLKLCAENGIKVPPTWFALSEQRPLLAATSGGPEAVEGKASQNWPRRAPKTPLLDLSWPVDDGRR